MRVLLIDKYCGTGSTGKIACAIAEEYERQGHEAKVAYGRDNRVPERFKRFGVRIGTMQDVIFHAVMTRLTDRNGFYTRSATRKFLKWADEYKPDILWLHNIHGYYINIEMLFNWIKSRPEMKVFWTLHDCWTFTGHCTHFIVAKCDKWKTHCERCPQKSRYPSSIIDNSRRNYDDKRRLFTGVKDMTIITPSKWLADLVKKSFLKDYPVEVRHNTIDREIFRPTPSDFRKRFGLEGKIIVLGVANFWDKYKGLEDFVKLSEMLDPEKFALVLVGLTPKQIKSFHKNIIAIQRTTDQKELAKIYTTADVYVNPSREETFGMTNIEAEACGTKSIVYEGTACAEIAEDTGGIVVPPNADYLYDAIISTMGGGGCYLFAYSKQITRQNSLKFTQRQMYSFSQAMRRITLPYALRPKPAEHLLLLRCRRKFRDIT